MITIHGEYSRAVVTLNVVKLPLIPAPINNFITLKPNEI